MSKSTKQGVAAPLAEDRLGIPATQALSAACAERISTQAKSLLSKAEPSAQSCMAPRGAKLSFID